jgi:hypothetical protein
MQTQPQPNDFAVAPMSTPDLFALLRDAIDGDAADETATHYAPPIRLARPRPPAVRPLRDVCAATQWRQGRCFHQSESFFDVQRYMLDLQAAGFEVRCYPVNSEWSRVEFRTRSEAA